MTVLKKENKGGRPRKYAGASRPITVTLPEAILSALDQIGPDRGRAIVRLTEQAMHVTKTDTKLVELVQMAPGTGLIVIAPSRALRHVPFLRLIEVAPARFLLALDPGHDFKSLELAIRDVLDDVGDTESRERELLKQLLAHIASLRKSDRVSMAEILIVRTDPKPRK